MSYPECLIDSRPVLAAGRICGACWADLRHDLTELAESLADDLDATLAGLGRRGGVPIGIVARSAETGLGWNERAGDLARQLHNTLGGWVRVLCEDNALPVDMADRTTVLAEWLRAHEVHVRAHEAVGDLWDEIRSLAAQARQAIDRRPDRSYLGICSAPTGEGPCPADLYVIGARLTVHCPACGTGHHVEYRRDVMVAAVAGQLGTAVEVSRALSAMTGTPVPVNTIRSWALRGKLAQHPPREGERHPRYRIADVERLLHDTARRAG